jgi:hypothetical protein
LDVDKDEARRKEAERTLKRIKGTLHHLEDGSAWEDPLQSEEFQRMKGLIESGYTRQRPGLSQRLLTLLRHPVFLLLLVIAVVLLVNWLQR